MTNTPTDRQVQELFRQLHNLSRKAIPDGPTLAESLEQRVLNACHRNRSIDTEAIRRRDGFPTGAGPGDGGEHTPDSSTQAAAFANIGALYDGNVRARRDPIDDLVSEAWVSLREGVGQLVRLMSLLTQIDKLSDPRQTTNPATACQACDRMVECTSADPIRAGYCSACSMAWYRWRDAELAAGREPDRARFERERRQDAA